MRGISAETTTVDPTVSDSPVRNGLSPLARYSSIENLDFLQVGLRPSDRWFRDVLGQTSSRATASSRLAQWPQRAGRRASSCARSVHVITVLPRPNTASRWALPVSTSRYDSIARRPRIGNGWPTQRSVCDVESSQEDTSWQDASRGSRAMDRQWLPPSGWPVGTQSGGNRDATGTQH